MPDERRTAEGLAERLARPGPKRLLSLDGGGIRGILSLAYLEAVETMLRRRYGRADLCLADHFDLIGGTSTGALIATMLALGWTVADARAAYLNLSADVFRPRRYWGLGPVGRAIASRFSAQPLEAILESILGDASLDSPKLRTGLMIVAKRIDTASVWPLTNLPTARYYDDWTHPEGQRLPGNRHLKLRELLRASTAAPTLFRPKSLTAAGTPSEAMFVDGAVSAHNNPSLMLLMVAVLDGFGLHWPLGPDDLLLCSVGTGRFSRTDSAAVVARYTNIDWAQILVPQMIGDTMELVETVLQWMSVSPTARRIDSMIGSVETTLGGDRGLVSYVRYDATISVPALAALGLDVDDAHIARLRDMSSVAAIPDLLMLGTHVQNTVRDDHFPVAFVEHAA